MSNDFSPKNNSAPCCSNSMIFLKIEPVELVEILPYSASNSSLPSSVAYCSTFLKSFKSNNGKLLSSQYLKMIETTPDCVSFKSKIRENKTGPNSETVALNRTPFCSEIVINSTGNPLVSYGRVIFS